MAERDLTAPSNGGVSLREASRRTGVRPQTLGRWAKQGVIPQFNGSWTEPAIAHARVVARLRERGHTLQSIRRATDEGRLAFGYVEALFPEEERKYTLEQAGKATDLDPALVERIITALGWSPVHAQSLSEEDLQLLRYVSAVLAAGLPLVALLQLVRVYGQAMAQVADAEVRLFHLYVHEPLMRSGADGLEMAEEMLSLTRELLPLASPVMDQVHQRYLQHFVEQDVVGHMESDLGDDAIDLGRLRVAIAFADLAGYTRLTEEAGELEAVDAVERFVEAVEVTLPETARVIKTIGDEVMVVGSDAGALTDWAVGFQRLQTERPLPRIGLHYGEALYRDGDYYGRDVNIASRVSARSAAGEVLVTRPVVGGRGPAPGVRADRRGPAEGLQRVDRDLPRLPARRGRRVTPAARPAPPRSAMHDDSPPPGAPDSPKFDPEAATAADRRHRPAGAEPGRAGDALRRPRLDCAARHRRTHRWPGHVEALHVNYRLRDEAAADEDSLRALSSTASTSSGSTSGSRSGRHRKRPGLGPPRAICRGAASSPRRHRRRPHGHRPGRDDPLPAGLEPKPTRAAWDARPLPAG